MSRIFYLKDLCEEIYTESVATEHPDIAKQRNFAKKAEKILAARKKAREQSKNPKVKKAVEFFSKSKINIPTGEMVDEAHWDPVSKTIGDIKRTGTDPEIQKMAARAAASGPKKRKPVGSVRKNSETLKPSSPEEAQTDIKRWNRYWEGSWKNKKVNEDITIEDANGKAFAEVIDLIKNTNIKFKGFSSVKEENTTDKLKDIKEATDGIGSRSKNYRLDRWFDDGGWVQTGGKYDGKPCAKQPGQKTKPYCRDPDDRAELTKDERNKRAAKKRKEDSNPNRSGEAKVVTQESAGEKDACYTKVKSRYKIWPSAYASGALVKCRKVGADSWGTKTEAVNPAQQAAIAISMKEAGKKPKSKVKEEYIEEREMTSAETKKEKELKSKYDDSGMKASMIKQYGKEEGEKIYFATIRKQSMKDEVEYDDVYAYVIEMLVAAEFAENYEAAEVMFEHMSDEFTSAIVEEYIEEKARGTRKKTTVHAYDVDETLFGHGKKGKPNVQVHVNDASGKRVKSLSNQEFNTHKLDKDHSYDFSEFQSAKKFSQTASPNKKVIKDIKRKQARGQNVHLITARSKFDKPSEFQSHLKKHGVDVDKKNIHYTGGMKGGDIGKKKVDVANAVAKQSNSKSIHMYDDAAKVHKAFEKEKKEAPTSKKIKTHMVAPDKKGESRVRSYQATKEEMTSYEYWKQFIN